MNPQLKNRMLLDPHFFSHPEATLLKLKPEYCLELPEVAINQDTPPWVLKTLLRRGTYHQRYAAARVCSDPATLEETFDPKLHLRLPGDTRLQSSEEREAAVVDGNTSTVGQWFLSLYT